MSYLKLNPIIKKFIIVVFLYGLTSSSFNGFFGIYVVELGHPESLVGTVLALRRFAVALFTFFIAFIAGKIGHKRTLMLGLATVGLSSIAIVLVEDITMIMAMAMVFGFGQAAMLTVESPFLYHQAGEEERVHAFSLTFATRNAAFMTGSLVTGLLADYFATYMGAGVMSLRYSLLIISLMSLIALFPLALLKPKAQKKAKPLSAKEFRGFFTKMNVSYLFYTGLIGLGAGLVVPFFGVYLKYMLDTTDSIVGLILSFAQLGTVVGGLSVPMIGKRIGSYKTIVLTQILSIPLLIAIGFPQGLLVVAVAFFLRSSLMNMGQPLIRNISMDIVSEKHRPLMASMRAMINSLTRAAGIFFGGALMEGYTYNTPYIFTILLYLLGTVVFYRLFRSRFLGAKEAATGEFSS